MDHLEASWFSVEQNSCLVVDKLSSTSVDFIRSERELKKTVLIWSLTVSLSMLRACWEV